jgi:phosphoribosylglycinamide formyltransferase-1
LLVVGCWLKWGRTFHIQQPTTNNQQPTTNNQPSPMPTIAIFASGAGSNARKILEHFAGSETIRVGLVVSNKKDAGVLGIAAEYGVPTHLIDRASFFESEELLEVLRRHDVTFLVLAGFLWLVPPYLIRAFPGRIVNIHPALLPKYGGKGMYGHFVHEAVRRSGDTETGITIHFVDERYDEGDVIFQARCPVEAGDTAADIARKVHALEHAHFPGVIEQVIRAGSVGFTQRRT